MLTTHHDVINWLAEDKRNVDIFLKKLKKIVKEKIILVSDEFSSVGITMFRADSKHSRIRR